MVMIGLLFWKPVYATEMGQDGDPEPALSLAMEIHAIYLPAAKDDAGEANGGDAVLLKSGEHYLLMDGGTTAEAEETVIPYLKKLGVTDLDLYVSHLHEDHYQGIEAVLDQSSGITVHQVYVPYIGIDPAYTSDTGVDYRTILRVHLSEPARKAGAKVIGLYYDSDDMLEDAEDLVDETATGFSFGGTDVEIIGPVYDLLYKDQKLTVGYFASQDGSIGSMKGHYLNNRSLVAKITDGRRTFLSAGDIEQEEEAAMIRRHGDALKADIYKMSHHGYGTSNSEAFLGKVKANWTFAENSSATGFAKEANAYGIRVRMTYTQRKNASAYGFVCMVGDEKEHFVLRSDDQGVEMALADPDSGMETKLGPGWVSVKGSYGVGLLEDRYYLDTNGKARTGIRKLKGPDGNEHYYNLGTGGCLECGYVSDKPSEYAQAIGSTGYYYNFYRNDNGKYRYYPNYKTGEMAAGITVIKGKNYYFSKTDGYRMKSNARDGEYAIMTMDGKKYAMKNNGYIHVTKGAVKIGKTGYAYIGSAKNLVTGYQSGYYYHPSTCMRCGSPIRLSSVKSSKKKAVVKWTTAKKATGYYIYRSTKKATGYKKIKTITKRTTVSYTDKKVKKKKRYYYKVTPYLTVKIGSKSTRWSGKTTAVKSVVVK